MEKLAELLFAHGGLIELVVFVVPGFIAWRTYQWRRPQGEQKAADAFVDIVAFSVLVSLLWFWRRWTVWPASVGDALLFGAELFATPILLALVYESAVEFAANRHWITSPHPRAWDYLFNSLAYGRDGHAGSGGLFLIVTTKTGDKIAGVYSKPGFASLWPYDRDLLLGQIWQLVDGTPTAQVAGSVGLYIDATIIASIEVLDYAVVLQSALDRAKEQNANEQDLDEHDPAEQRNAD